MILMGLFCLGIESQNIVLCLILGHFPQLLKSNPLPAVKSISSEFFFCNWQSRSRYHELVYSGCQARSLLNSYSHFSISLNHTIISPMSKRLNRRIVVTENYLQFSLLCALFIITFYLQISSEMSNSAMLVRVLNCMHTLQIDCINPHSFMQNKLMETYQ